MPAKGRGLGQAVDFPGLASSITPVRRPAHCRRMAMNEHAKSKKFQPVPQTVTTGPIAGSHKVYAAPKSHPDMRVPLREILLSDALEPPVRVYDPSGPYTETDARIDLAAGLPAVRESWIEARGFDIVEGPAIKPEDNGN